MTGEEFRAYALEMSDAVEGSHMGHADFRVGGRIFASLGAPDAEHGMVKLTPELQEIFMLAHPKCFRPAAGSWGLRGSTLVLLEAGKPKPVKDALTAAWRNTLSKEKRRKQY